MLTGLKHSNLTTFQPSNKSKRILREHDLGQHGVAERRGYIMPNDFLMKILVLIGFHG